MKKVFFTLMALSLTFASCDSDTTAPESSDTGSVTLPQTGAKPTLGLQNLRKQALNDINQGGQANYNARLGLTFTTKSGSTIVIPAYSIKDQNGNDIFGTIKIDYIEIFTKEKMAVTNKPTLGVTSNQSVGVLETGGEFYLDIQYNGQQVAVSTPIKVNISTSSSQAISAGMVLWNGVLDGEENLLWNPTSATNGLVFENDGNIFGGRGVLYDILVSNSSNFGWCNIDRFASFPGPKTTLTVVPPTGFNYTNSSVYIAVEGEDNMLVQVYKYNTANNTFVESNGWLPIGMKCHIIFVGEQSGNYVYRILSTTLGTNPTYTITNTSLITTTAYGQVEAAIAALP